MADHVPEAIRSDGDVVKLASGAGLTLGGRVAGGAFQVLAQVALARLLGPQGFGLYAIGWVVLRMGELVSTLGLDSGVIRFASRYWTSDPVSLRAVLVRSISTAVLAGGAVGTALFVAAPWLANEVFKEPELSLVFRLFALAFPLLTGLRVSAAATRVSQQMRFAVAVEDLCRPIVNLLLVLLFFAFGWELVGAVMAGVASVGVAFGLAIFYVRGLLGEALPAQQQASFRIQELFGFSLTSALAFVSGMLITWIDRLFVGYFRSADEVGIYQAVAQLSIVFTLTLGAVNAIFSPMVADLHHRGERERLEELLRISTKWMLYLSVPVCLILWFASKEALIAIYGEQYALGSVALSILVAAQMVNVGTGSVGYVLLMTGRQVSWFVISACMLLMSLILNGLLVPRLGLTGAAIGTALATSGMYVGGLVRVRQALGFWPYDRRYVKGIVATSVALVALLVFRVLGPASPILHLLFVSLLATGAFGGTMLLLGADDEDSVFIQLVRRRLASSRASE